MADDREPGILSEQGRDLARLGIGGALAAAFGWLWWNDRLPTAGNPTVKRYDYDRNKRPVLQPAIVNTTYTQVQGIPGGVYNDSLIYPGDPDYWLKPGDPGYGQPIVKVSMGFS